MDYNLLADELILKMYLFHKAKHSFDFDESFKGEAFVLKFLRDCNGDVIPKDISCIMGISTARTTAALNNLEKKELITREIDKIDRRKILVRLTEKGEILAFKQQEKFKAHMVKILVKLGEHDSKEYVRIIAKMSEIMMGISQEKSKKE